MTGQLKLSLDWPRAGGTPGTRALIRVHAEDFEVEETLGFVADGDGEHSLLQIEKRGLNTADIVRGLSRLAAVPERDIGYCGLKDKHAVTRQWFSVGLAGRAEPDWSRLEDDSIRVLQQHRHRRKLRRGVHRGNRFRLRLRELRGERDELEKKLQQLKAVGVPNYYGEQRFGRAGGNLKGALGWLTGSERTPRRQRKSLYLSTARSFLFNELLGARVREECWQIPQPGDVCILSGSSSFFACDGSEPGIQERAAAADLHLGLPLWGSGRRAASAAIQAQENACIGAWSGLCQALEQQGLRLAYRPARLIADDFCWQFCDDDQLQLNFELVSGGFATAVLRELVLHDDNSTGEQASGE
ncbi:MAG: tRNA pseudouridine(13) synthase TruD [Gammaproteobacteria bacterium]|nr:tRNA pseudouridine(13) synthase TruD [Gammaproteobacteria bacterium]